MTVSGWTIGWLLWIAWFVVEEGVALARKKPGASLSEHVWTWFNVFDRRPTVLVIIGRAALAIGAIWLAGHFAMGWWTPTHPWPGM